jgi:hypothetical protein
MQMHDRANTTHELHRSGEGRQPYCSLRQELPQNSLLTGTQDLWANKFTCGVCCGNGYNNGLPDPEMALYLHLENPRAERKGPRRTIMF